MSNVPNPGLRGQSTARTIFRGAGVALLLMGAALVGSGIYGLLNTMNSDSMEAPVGPMAQFIIGGLCLVFGMGFANAGFMGLAARYAAGEGAPVVKDTAAYLTDGEGVLGVGRIVDDPDAKFCASCGKTADEAARFCESCGHAFA